jgi:hypothetical protein
MPAKAVVLALLVIFMFFPPLLRPTLRRDRRALHVATHHRNNPIDRIVTACDWLH